MEFQFMLYPAFDFIEQRGQIIPNIRLPENYKELVPKFYEQGRKPDVEDYARTIQENFLKGDLEIKLNWNKEQGLTNISVGPSGGLDLSEQGWPKFQEHNLGTKTGIASGFIAMKYISELLKSR
jgi:hypothetical protein